MTLDLTQDTLFDSPRYSSARLVTRPKLRETELYQWLVERTGRSEQALARVVWKSTKDARRLFTKAQESAIIKRDGTLCAYCGCEPDMVHIDHVIPHHLGGQTVIANGVIACTSCNLTKSGKLF